jgi:hypothetical protein
LSNPRQALQTEPIQTNKNACDEMASAFYAEAGRRIPCRVLINEPGLIGSIRIHPRTYGDKVPSIVAVPNVSDSPIAERIELLEPQLLMLGDQALICPATSTGKMMTGRLTCCGNGAVSWPRQLGLTLLLRNGTFLISLRSWPLGTRVPRIVGVYFVF